MPAARDVDWQHVHVLGDKAVAARYLPFARKLLGFVKQDASFNKLGVRKEVRRFDDGTVVIAELIGSIPRITIQTVPRVPQEIPLEIDGFYFAPVPTAKFDLPVIMTEPTKASNWRAHFFSKDALGDASVPKSHHGLPYAALYGRTMPDAWGTKLAPTNGYWEDAKTKEVVSWFKGYLAYWPEHYRHPVTNYLRLVSIHGRTIYTAPNPAWRVLCAAKRDGWLYVMLAEDLGALETPARAPAPSYPGDVWYSQPYSATPYTYALWRYPIAPKVEPDTSVETYTTDLAEGQRLWRGTLELAYAAWTFNKDVTQCVTVQLPRKAVMVQKYKYTESGPSPYIVDPDEQDEYPEATANRITLAIHEENGHATASMSMALAGIIAAEEDGVALKVVQTRGAYPRWTSEYQCDGFSITACDSKDISIGYTRLVRMLIYAHIPTKTFLFYKLQAGDPSGQMQFGYELYVGGQQVPMDGAITTLASTVYIPERDMFGQFWGVMGTGRYGPDGHSYAWFRPFDAVTFLLGMAVSRSAGSEPGSSVSMPSKANPGATYVPRIIPPYTKPHLTTGGIYFSTIGGTSGWSWIENPDVSISAGRPFLPNGQYSDPSPSSAATMSAFGGALAHDKDALFDLNFYPIAALYTDDGGYSPMADFLSSAKKFVFGTHGDAKPILNPIASNRIGSFLIAHTGKGRKSRASTPQPV